MCFFLLLLFCGCNSKTELSSPEQLSLQGEELKMNEVLILGYLEIYKSRLLMTRGLMDEKTLSIIDLNDLSVLSNTIRRGRGPGEIAVPAHMIIDGASGVLWFSDFGKNMVFRYPLDSLVANPEFEPVESFSLNPAWIPTMNMFFHPSNCIGFTSVMLQKNLISFMNLQGQLIDSLAIPNKIYPDLWKDGGISDNPLICKYIPVKDQIVLASRFENKVSVIDMKGNVIFRKDVFPAQTGNEQSLGSHKTFCIAEADKDFIFLLYSGKKQQGYDSDLGRSVSYYPNRLLVIDWEGQERYDINLDHPIIFMKLDKLAKRLIGVTEDFDNYLVSYDLSELYDD